MRSMKTIFAASIFILMLSGVNAIRAQKDGERVDNRPETPTLGSLVITSNPAGATILINNRPQGTTTADKGESKPFSLKPGRYKVEVRYPEYENFFDEVNIVAGKAEAVNAQMVPKFAHVVLTLPDARAQQLIKLDNRVPENLIITDNNTVTIKTTPGAHSLLVDRRGYKLFEKDVKLAPGDRLVVPANLELKLATLVLKANAGSRVYVDGAPAGDIPSNGELVLNTILPDEEHKIKVELDGFLTYEEALAIAAEQSQTLTVSLTPKPVSAAFTDDFLGGLSRWQAPKEWETANSLLRVKGAPGVGLPKNTNYRDAEIVFGLKLNNTRGAAWVVRAKDDKNFYLFHLTGSDARFPNQFRVYLCRDGQYDLMNPVAPPQRAPLELKPNESYRIRISLERNVVTHLIFDDTGTDYKLGYFEDPNKTFSYGSAGFMALEGHDFYIHAFTIEPKADKP